MQRLNSSWQRVALALTLSFTSAAQGDFRIVEFDSGRGVTQTAVVDANELHVFSANDDDSRHRQSFPLDGSEPGPMVNLSDELIFVDEIITPHGKKIALIERGMVKLLHEDSVLLKFSSLYNAPVFQTIPHANVFRDLNDDGLDDFIIPAFEGYEVAVQREDGSFSAVTTLKAVPLMDMSYNSHPWYQAKSLFVADMTGDGRVDLGFWQDNVFEVYAQTQDGTFQSTSLRLETEVKLDFDSVDGMSLRFSNEDQSNKTVKVIHSLADYDGDGVTDLMAMEVRSEGVLNKTTTFSLHAGSVEPAQEGASGIVRFNQEPRSVVESNGIQYEMYARDLDGDEDLDLMISSVELGVGKLIGALLTSSIKIDLGFYPMTDGVYPKRPAATKNMTASFSLASGEYWIPAVQLLDQDQDQRLDLMIQDSESAWNVYPGVEDGDLFTRRPTEVKVAVPKDPDLIRQVDVDLDGMMDLLVHIPPPIGQTSGHRVVLLFSKSEKPL